MPTYDYECDACGHTFELFQSISEPVQKKCPKCGKLKLRRLFGTGAAVVFKGSGFYQTDYRSESYKSDAKAGMLDTAMRLTDSKGRTFARRLGACLRLSYNLSGGAPGLLPRVQLRRSERELRLVIPADLKRSLGEVTARRLESAAEAFDLKAVIVPS